jgi:hypothetical protein
MAGTASRAASREGARGLGGGYRLSNGVLAGLKGQDSHTRRERRPRSFEAARLVGAARCGLVWGGCLVCLSSPCSTGLLAWGRDATFVCWPHEQRPSPQGHQHQGQGHGHGHTSQQPCTQKSSLISHFAPSTAVMGCPGCRGYTGFPMIAP